MERPSDAPFEVHALDRLDLRAPMTSGMRRLAPDDRDRLHASRRAMEERFAPFGPRLRRRLAFYVAGSVVFLPLVNLLLTPLGPRTLWLQIPMAAAYGAVIAWTRLRQVLAGLLLAAMSYLTLFLTGYRASLGSVVILVWPGVVWLCVGMLVGAQEDIRAIDGE